MSMWFYIFIAMVGAVGINFGLILQKKGVQNLPKILHKGFHPSALGSFLKSKVWLLGILFTTIGWILYVIAVAKVPVSIVQPVFGFGLVVVAFFGVVYLHEHLGFKDITGIIMIISGIILLGLSTKDGGNAGVYVINITRMIIFSTGIGVVLFGIGVSLPYLGKMLTRASFLGISSGLLTGIAAVFTKCIFLALDADQTLLGFFVYLPLCLIGNIVGMIVLQGGFQSGRAIEVVSASNVLNKITAIAGGMWFLGEVLPQDRLLAIGRLVGFATILLGTWFLGKITGDVMNDVEKEATIGSLP